MTLLHLGRLRVSKIIITVNVILILCLGASSMIMLNALNHLKIHGPFYTQIRNTVDLTADILPPPLYLLEEYMTVLQLSLAGTEEERKSLEDHLTQLEKNFDARQDYWKEIDLADSTRKVLNDEVTPPARKMLQAIHDKLLPSMRANDKEEFVKALSEVTINYKEHRNGIDHLLTLVTNDLNDAESSSTSAERAYLMWIYTSLGITLLATILGAFGLTVIVAKPLESVTSGLAHLAQGNTNVSIGDSAGDGEIPRLWRSVTALREKVMGEKKLLAAQEEAKRLNEEDKRKSMHELADSFQSQIGSIVNAVSAAATQLQSTSESMRDTAQDTTHQSETVATASEQASANVQTVSAATEELTASIREIQNRIEQSSGMVDEAVQQAQLTNDKVQSLTEAANKIGAVVNLISDIAAQTNLLALNATIEAARAGEAGKGFAVVASEVKALATQTAKATEDISLQVANIQTATAESAQSIQMITKTIDDVSQTSSAIAAAVEEQGAATQEISKNIGEAAQGTKRVSDNIANVREAAQMTGASASQVLAAAGELSKNGEALKSQVELFLNKIRSA